ncbi:hypothetical protein L6452_32633 [Arctium lappa]|uniref:Uncharacterized protein n=1 Tax=Arctium lappa TaxID=4217 RepID=A0ACB8Z515_ARCLA|nr:hypothetical protein L6452_32633 [Arctium lappa]
MNHIKNIEGTRLWLPMMIKAETCVSSEDEGEASRNGSVISQEAMDEALARSLQELGEEFDEFFITQFSGSANGITENPIATPTVTSSDSSQEDIDPDNMQHEELVNHTETVGVGNRGLSPTFPGYQPPSTHQKCSQRTRKKNA